MNANLEAQNYQIGQHLEIDRYLAQSMRAESIEEQKTRLLRDAPLMLNVHVTVHHESEAEREARGIMAFCESIRQMWQRRIDVEKAKGNPLFANIETQEQYQAACEADDKIKDATRRKELGFWKYHFGG